MIEYDPIAVEGVDFEYVPWTQIRVSGGVPGWYQMDLWYPFMKRL